MLCGPSNATQLDLVNISTFYAFYGSASANMYMKKYQHWPTITQCLHPSAELGMNPVMKL